VNTDSGIQFLLAATSFQVMVSYPTWRGRRHAQ
jgi:hypothetical protein